MRGRSHVDVVVVGAGAAGLGATQAARELGLDVLTLEAMDRVGGRANKIALQPEAGVLADLHEHGVAVPIGSGQMIGLRIRPFGRNLVDGYVAGPACVELEAAGEAAMVDAAMGALVTLLGSHVRRRIRATAVSRWANEPYIRGTYAAALPGRANRRADLARPLADRLFFAGEATSAEFFTTCDGAWETGVAAAHAVAQVVNRRGAGAEGPLAARSDISLEVESRDYDRALRRS